MLFTIMPAFFISITALVVNIGAIIYSAVFDQSILLTCTVEFFKILSGVYLTLFVVGIISGVTEWNKIHANVFKKIVSFFTFPLFMMTYLPISAVALFKRVVWAPIEHTDAVTLDEITNS
jgi:hypothetical protein